ncbi:recombinase family protein [Baekduia sp. Peel2402]|uniref:recombinase family protein n=1 Tax=Baekduia sp. Peel2402 TaxID=3458296 RepID=UPI00403EB478
MTKTRAKKPEAGVRAALGIRVSTKEQAIEGTSVETQTAILQAHAEQVGWTVVGVYVDAGVSGDMPVAERPEAGRMMDLAARGGVDVVAVKDLDRFGRDVVETLTAERELERAGVAFVSVGENIDTRRDSDRMNLQLRAVIAEQEKRRMLERMASGLRARAAEGAWTGGPPPFGFELVPRSDAPGAKNVLAHDEREVEILRTATALILDDGHSTWTAGQKLDSMGMGPRVGLRWTNVNLRRILLSPTLGGVWFYKPKDGDPIEVAIPPVLDPDRHAALLDALGETSTERSPSASYLLSHGRLVGTCGASYHGISRKDRGSRWYRCRSKRPGPHEKCEDVNVHAGTVEALVWGEVASLLSEPDRLTALADEYLDLEPARDRTETETVEAIERKLAALGEDRTQRVATALEAGVDAATLRAALSKLDNRARALEAHRARLVAAAADREVATTRAERLRDLADSARAALATMGPDERRAVLDLLDVRVTVTGWQPCDVCGGKGKVQGGRGGTVCQSCHAQRRVPSFEVQGVVAEALDVGQLGAEVSRPSTCSPR